MQCDCKTMCRRGLCPEAIGNYSESGLQAILCSLLFVFLWTWPLKKMNCLMMRCLMPVPGKTLGIVCIKNPTWCQQKGKFTIHSKFIILNLKVKDKNAPKFKLEMRLSWQSAWLSFVKSACDPPSTSIVPTPVTLGIQVPPPLLGDSKTDLGNCRLCLKQSTIQTNKQKTQIQAKPNTLKSKPCWYDIKKVWSSRPF